MNIIQKIDETVKKYNMLSKGDRVNVGVSGGKDSMLLLCYLLKKRDELGISLCVMNVEHGIRGEASLSDTAFVKRFCEENGVEFRGISINAPEEAVRAGLGVEEYSRNKRYEFFESVSADKIATAHSLSDNVETVLFRLARGTSLNGFKGIPPVRGKIIRPLIECTGEEIISACEELKIPYVTDETNFDNSYTRNRIRNEIVPLLKSINPSAESAINRFISSAAEDNDYIYSVAEKYVEKALNKEKIKSLHPAVIKRVIELYASKFGVVLDELHLGSVTALLYKTGKTQIKEHLFAFSNKDTLYFSEYSEKNINFHTESSVKSVDEYKKYINEFTFYCDNDKIVGEAFVRTRDEGDTISPAGRCCTKTLKKLFNELGVPVPEREYLPVICDSRGVIGVLGYALDERVKIDSNTSSVFILKIDTEDCINE